MTIEEVFAERWAFTPSAATMAHWEKQVVIATENQRKMCLELPADVFAKLPEERQAELRAQGWKE